MRIEVKDLDHLKAAAGADLKDVVVGFFGSYSEISKTAEAAFKAFCETHPESDFYSVDTGTVKDVHRAFGIKAVPSVVRIREGRVVQGISGISRPQDYMALLSVPVKPAGNREAKKSEPLPVTVYTSTNCPWCGRVKNYLREKGVRFREIDISRDEGKMRDLVDRTGQTGVPQVKIGSHYVVGFDKNKIDGLLGL